MIVELTKYELEMLVNGLGWARNESRCCGDSEEDEDILQRRLERLIESLPSGPNKLTVSRPKAFKRPKGG